MKRIEIENQIRQSLTSKFVQLFDDEKISELTDLFIQLSEERCKEQREICALIDTDDYSEAYDGRILNAPFPTLD